jgi:hypothetical protein
MAGEGKGWGMTGQRIIRPDTAFSIASTKQKRPRIRDDNHLAFIRGLKCCICGKPGPDPAHIRSANALYGKRETGGGEKASDKFTVPLCREHHDEQHKAGNELLWWASKGVDPFGLALSLYACTGDDEIAEGILRSNIARARSVSM